MDPTRTLKGRSLEIWNEYFPILSESGRLLPEEHGILALFCEAFESWEDAARRVRDTTSVASSQRATRAWERSHVVGENGPEGPDAWLHASDAPTGARARPSRAITAATLQAARDMRLCMAKTRNQGFPCVRRVAPGRNRCVSHGGASTGPRTPEGRKRIADAQRERWRRYREERGQ